MWLSAQWWALYIKIVFVNLSMLIYRLFDMWRDTSQSSLYTNIDRLTYAIFMISQFIVPCQVTY